MSAEGDIKGTAVPLTRAELDRAPKTLLKSATSVFAADLLALGEGDGRLVLRDYAARPWLVRSTWGRVSIAREAAAYRRLQGVEGVPRFVGTPDACSLLISFVVGETLVRRNCRRDVGYELFLHLESLLAEIHARGVAHGDVRRKNIIVTPDRKPCLIDFETAVIRGPLTGWLFRTVAGIDMARALKIRGEAFARRLTDEERARLRSPGLLLRGGRFLRRTFLRRWSKRARRGEDG